MVDSLFATQSSVIREGLSDRLGCTADDLESEQLIVVELPVVTRPGVLARLACSGFGAVASVEPSLVQWVRENAPKDHHFRALQPFFLEQIAQRAMETGLATVARGHGYSTGFALNTLNLLPLTPPGLRLELVDSAWIARYRDSKVFDNALGAPEEVDRIARTHHAVVALDATGDPAAVAGWWDDGHGYQEIGVDVRRDARGLGLGKLVTTAATRHIVEAAQAPFYVCGITNIRSHRNALACGFLPVYVIGLVRAVEE